MVKCGGIRFTSGRAWRNFGGHWPKSGLKAAQCCSISGHMSVDVGGCCPKLGEVLAQTCPEIRIGILSDNWRNDPCRTLVGQHQFCTLRVWARHAGAQVVTGTMHDIVWRSAVAMLCTAPSGARPDQVSKKRATRGSCGQLTPESQPSVVFPRFRPAYQQHRAGDPTFLLPTSGRWPTCTEGPPNAAAANQCAAGARPPITRRTSNPWPPCPQQNATG